MSMQSLRKVLIIVALTMGMGGVAQAAGFEIISQQAAWELMQKPGDYVIVDVRNEDEYVTGHIPNAVLVPLPNLAAAAAEKLQDKAQLLLVYCRSGRRSKIAAQKLAEMGYSKIKEFGGIITWPYTIVR